MHLNLSDFQCVVLVAIVGILVNKYLRMYLKLKRLQRKPPITFRDSHTELGASLAIHKSIVEPIDMPIKTHTKQPKTKKMMRHPSTRFKHKVIRRK